MTRTVVESKYSYTSWMDSIEDRNCLFLDLRIEVDIVRVLNTEHFYHPTTLFSYPTSSTRTAAAAAVRFPPLPFPTLLSLVGSSLSKDQWLSPYLLDNMLTSPISVLDHCHGGQIVMEGYCCGGPLPWRAICRGGPFAVECHRRDDHCCGGPSPWRAIAETVPKIEKHEEQAANEVAESNRLRNKRIFSYLNWCSSSSLRNSLNNILFPILPNNQQLFLRGC